MERAASRIYRRHKRKLACSYCSSRHIRCRTPDHLGNPSASEGHRGCQACLDANEECDMERPSKASSSEVVAISSRSARDFKQQQSRAPVTAPLELHSSPEPEYAARTTARNNIQRVTSITQDLSDPPVREGTQWKKGADTLFVQLMDSHEHDSDENHPTSGSRSNKVLYFGNDSIWSYSLQKARSSNPRLSRKPRSDSIHYEVPSTLDDRPSDDVGEDYNLRQEEMKLHRKKGAFSLPPIDVQKGLLDAYFCWLYPLQPIFDKNRFMYDFETGQISIVLLKAVLFAATTCCDEDIVKKAWNSRRSAQVMLYGHVKTLYDAGYEKDRITIVQVLFLMTFWWGSPVDEKDFRHWLAAGIHLAQVMGMHRSTKHSHLSIKDRRQWKRIWWIFYTRDHFDAASLGRPMIIHDDDCDVETLSMSDFEDIQDQDDSSVGFMHCIEMAKLAVLIGHIIRARQQSQVANPSVKQIDDKLCSWEQALPQKLIYTEGERDPQAKLFAAMLYLGFHFCKILLHRKIFLDTKSDLKSSSTALTSANAVTRIIEELLTDGLLHRTQVHLIVVIFASFTVHVISLQQSEGPRRRVLQHKAQLCLLSLSELKDYWPFVGWMYRVFSILLDRLRTEDSQAKSPAPGILNASTTMFMSPRDIEGDITQDPQAQPADGDHNMPDMPSFEDLLDPFMPLDTLAWYDRDLDPLGNPGTDGQMWSAWPGSH